MSTETLVSSPLREPSSFDETAEQSGQMHDQTHDFVGALTTESNVTISTPEFRTYLNILSRFPWRSAKNALLIFLQKPDATYLAEYETWTEEYAERINRGATTIWIWEAIRGKKCPTCGNSPSYHDEELDCNGHIQGNPEAWAYGTVGYRPKKLYDVADTTGTPPAGKPQHEQWSVTPDLLLNVVSDVADGLGVPVTLVDESSWDETENGTLNRNPMTMQVEAKIKDGDPKRTLVEVIRHIAKARPLDDGSGIEPTPSPSKATEAEATAVAHTVCQHFNVEPPELGLTIEPWYGTNSDEMFQHLESIQNTVSALIKRVSIKLKGCESGQTNE